MLTQVQLRCRYRDVDRQGCDGLWETNTADTMSQRPVTVAVSSQNSLWVHGLPQVHEPVLNCPTGLRRSTWSRTTVSS